jgi:protein TonB
LSMLLAAPAPPVGPLPPMTGVANVAAHAAVLANPFTPPRLVPSAITAIDQEPPPGVAMGVAPLATNGGGPFAGLPDSIGTAVSPQVQVTPSRKPVISSGVMGGRKLSGAAPRYPLIAITARIQGTVLLAATISRTGAIENLRLVSGPPMLASAAEDAVRTWRYRPYLLNGEPVEVETTVRVIFNLGG